MPPTTAFIIDADVLYAPRAQSIFLGREAGLPFSILQSHGDSQATKYERIPLHTHIGKLQKQLLISQQMKSESIHVS